MPILNNPIKTFSNGGTIRIDNNSVRSTVIKVQKRIVHAEIKALGHNAPVANHRQEIIIVHALGIEELPATWQGLVQRQVEVDRVHILADDEEHLIHGHVTLLFDSSEQDLILQGSRYQ